MKDLRIHDLWFGECPLLGPSLYVWVQGCPRRCQGCFNQSALDEEGAARLMAPGAVVEGWAAVHGAGLVLSGGEPFSQAEGLAEVCRQVRARCPTAPVLTYTGYEIGELLTAGRRDWLDLLHETDVLVDGPFVQTRRTDLPLVGSDNQRILFLSGRVAPERLGDLGRPDLQLVDAESRPKRDQTTAGRSRRIRIVGTGSRDVGLHALIGLLRTHGLMLEGH